MRVLVCMDSSVYADEILNEIARRLWLDGTSFKLVTAVEAAGMWDCDQQNLHQAGQILSQRVSLLESRLKNRFEVHGEVLEGSAVSKINAEAASWEADLILIGSHGDTGVRKSGLGSVAAAVVNDAPCSVEVIKLRMKGTEHPQKPVSSSAKK